MYVVLLVGCFLKPQEGTVVMDSTPLVDTAPDHGGRPGEVSDGDGLQSGVLTTENARLYWMWYGYEEWPNGTCVQMRLQNTGSTVKDWTLEVGLDDQVNKWVYDDGAWVFPADDRLIIGSESGESLDHYEVINIYYCAEPRTIPESIRLTGGSSSSNNGSTDTTDTTDTTTTEPVLFGSVSDTTAALVLQYADAGYATNGGECLNLSLYNNGKATINQVKIAVEFPDSFKVTSLQGYILVSQSKNTLTLSPSYTSTIGPGGSNNGIICMDPPSAPKTL